MFCSSFDFHTSHPLLLGLWLQVTGWRGDVGFGIDSGHQLVPLMHIGICGNPNIGFGFTMACHFTWLLVVLVSTLHSGVKETSRDLKVW